MPPLPGLRASSLPPAPGYESDEEGGLCNKQKTSTSVFERTFENNNSNNNCTLIPLPGTRGNRNYDYEEEIARHDRSKEEPPLPSLSSSLGERVVPRGVRGRGRVGPSTDTHTGGNSVDGGAPVRADFDLD